MPESAEHSLGFETDLIFSEDSNALLGIKNEERVNRTLVTQERIGKTSYSLYARHIQYGTYQAKPACLVGIDISFRFPSKANSRFTYAEVEITFEKALDITNPSLRSTDASLDPVVANFAPKQILGTVVERENKTSLEFEVPLVFDTPFGSSGITATIARETTMTERGCLEVYGNLAQDDEHDDGANSVTWDLTENPISKDGILRSFRGIILLFCRPGETLWLHGTVKPVVSFSLDPRRLVTKKLVREKDQPIYLDGKTTLGNSVCLGYDKFDADNFPWNEVLNLPKSLGTTSAPAATES
jgi:hypothetical protein